METDPTSHCNVSGAACRQRRRPVSSTGGFAAAKEYSFFGKTAIFNADIPEGLLAKDWNIGNLGLFCGTKIIHPGRVVAYVYGIEDKRLRSGKPLEASFNIDGKITDLTLTPFNDVALAPLDGDFVRRFLRAKSVSIQVKDYGAPRPDRIKLEHVDIEA